MMIVGRIICGLGTAVISTSVPLYQRLFYSGNQHLISVANDCTVRSLLPNNEEDMLS